LLDSYLLIRLHVSADRGLLSSSHFLAFVVLVVLDLREFGGSVGFLGCEVSEGFVEFL